MMERRKTTEMKKMRKVGLEPGTDPASERQIQYIHINEKLKQ